MIRNFPSIRTASDNRKTLMRALVKGFLAGKCGANGSFDDESASRREARAKKMTGIKPILGSASQTAGTRPSWQCLHCPLSLQTRFDSATDFGPRFGGATSPNGRIKADKPARNPNAT